MNLTETELLSLLEALSLLSEVESFGIPPDSELGGFCALAVKRTATAKLKLQSEYENLNC